LKKKKQDKNIEPEIMQDQDPVEAAAEAAAKEAEAFEGETAEETETSEEEKSEVDSAENEWKEKYTRQLAEFDNFRKRTEKEKAQMYDFGAKVIAEKILPTIDNFERGLKGAPEGAFAEGMEMVYKQLLKNLEDAGVKAIDCVGKEFDPNLHNAVMHEEDDSGEENIVTEELQKGYMYKEALLRPSMVKVKN